MSRLKFALPTSPNRLIAVVERGFQILLSIVVVSVIYRYCWLDIGDPYKCGALLNKGQWLDPGPRWSSRNPFQNWQPPGCMMYEYKQKDIQECFQKRRLVFIGDSTTRQIFWAVAKKMDQEKAEEEMSELLDMEQKHINLEFTSGGVTVQYIWDPWLNSTGLDKELKSFRVDPPPGPKSEESAGLILLGSPGLWYARHGQENFFKDFRDSIEHVIPYMDHSRDQGPPVPRVEPFPSGKKSSNFLLMAPVQVPWYQALSPSRAETITPEKIDHMNDYLQQVSANSEADIVWSFSLMTWAGRGEYEESGLHVVDNVAHRKADVLLNLRCNANAAERGYPYERTCCNNYRQPNAIQWLLVLVGMIVIPSIFFVRSKHFWRLGRMLPQPEVLGALVTFALVVCYCYYADRTQLFEKEHKQYRRREFLIGCSTVMIVGLLSMRSSNPSKGIQEMTAHAFDQGFLSRGQTEEWKGWMQFLILIYHYTHGSKALSNFEFVRNLVAAYLFMTGFGHTMFFLTREDYSLKRVANVLVRLNLLSCVLPYMMRTDYLAYYFTPLVSFWFLITYFTLRTRREDNSNIGFLLTKILISAFLAALFIHIPGVLEFLGFILKYTCAISWNVKEFRRRASMDYLIVYIGMLMAIFYLRITRIRSSSITRTSVIDLILQPIARYLTAFKVFTTIAALVLIPGYILVTASHTKSDDFLFWHPYTSCIPVLSFIALRNSHRVLRNYNSVIFAWLGRCSLETFVLQTHIWLAADIKGLLRMGIWERWTEAAVLTALFLWISWKMADATQLLTVWIVNGGMVVGQGGGYVGKGVELPVVEEREGVELKDNVGVGLRDGNGIGNGNKLNGEDLKGGLRQVTVNGFVEKVKVDLRWRLGAILAVMWVANWVYR